MLQSVPIPISVLVVDDSDTQRASIINILSNELEINVVGEARNCLEGLGQVNALLPDVVIMDITIPSLDGVAVVKQITTNVQSVKVVVISYCEEEEYVLNCMKAGASGYIMKDALATELVQAIHVAHNGGHFFSPGIAKRIAGFYLKQVASVAS